MISKKIKVLVVDDSIVFREIIAKGISANPAIEVVGKAADPFEARDLILEFEPDVMTCDVEMPKMNGIEFIRRLLPQYVIPIIVVSSISESIFEAMEAGAVDFVTKPNAKSNDELQTFIRELVEKIIVTSYAKVIPEHKNRENQFQNNRRISSNKIIAIGASTGGTEALSKLLAQLPPTIPGILIVQHIPPIFSKMFAERLNKQISLQVKEAQSGDIVEMGKVFIAPGDQHMKVKKIAGKYKLEVFSGEKVNGHCPSVDILFDSIAQEAGKQAIGILLTGMGYDGARGLLSMRKRGAITLGQDEKSCVVYGMPKVAYDIGAVDKQVSLSKIPETLLDMLMK